MQHVYNNPNQSNMFHSQHPQQEYQQQTITDLTSDIHFESALPFAYMNEPISVPTSVQSMSTTSVSAIPSGSSTICTGSYTTNGDGFNCKHSYVDVHSTQAHIEEEYDPSHPSISFTGSVECDNLLKRFLSYPLKDIYVTNGLAMTANDKSNFSLLSAKSIEKPDDNKKLIGFVGKVSCLRSMPFTDYNNGYHNRTAKLRRKLNRTISSTNNNRVNNEACTELSDNENKMLRDILGQRDDHTLTYLRSVDPDVFRFINKEQNLTLVTLIPYFFLLSEQAQHINLSMFENPNNCNDFIKLLYQESENNSTSKLLEIYGNAICVVWFLLIKQYKMEIDELIAKYRFDIEVDARDNSGYLGHMQKTKSTLTIYNRNVTTMLENELPLLVSEHDTVRTITNLHLSAFSQICKEIRSLSITRNTIQQLLKCYLYKNVITFYRVTDDPIHKNFVDDSVAAKLIFDSIEHWSKAAIKRCASTINSYNDSVCVSGPMIQSNVDIIKETLLTKKPRSVGSVYNHVLTYIANNKNRELQYYQVFLKLLQRCGLTTIAKKEQDAVLNKTVIM